MNLRQGIAFIPLILTMPSFTPVTRGQAAPSAEVLVTNLRAGVAKADITPPDGMPMPNYGTLQRGAPATARDRCRSEVLVLDDGITRAAIVTLDVALMPRADGEAISGVVQRAAGISAEHIMINASHTHGCPPLSYRPEHKKIALERIEQACRAAAAALRPVSIGYGEGQIEFTVNRRWVNPQGKAEARLNPDGIRDPRVKVLRIDDGTSLDPMVVIMHAVCHPAVFRGENNQWTADFVGVAKAFVETNFGGRTTAMFLQGCTGDIRANLPGRRGDVLGGEAQYRHGTEEDMRWCGWSLGSEAVRVAARLRVREFLEQRPRKLKLAGTQKLLELTYDEKQVRARIDAARKAADQAVDEKQMRLLQQHVRRVTLLSRKEDCRVTIRALRVGPFVLVGISGEPVVEYGLGIEEDLKGQGNIFVMGYTPGDNEYIAVSHMIQEGGYEVRGAFSTHSEREIRQGVKALVEGLAR